LSVWVAFLIFNRKSLAWTAVGILIAIAVLGATMFLRWIPVYRGPARAAGLPQDSGGLVAVPAEGNFPVVVVTAHGLLAVSTLVLALLTARQRRTLRRIPPASPARCLSAPVASHASAACARRVCAGMRPA